MKDRKCKCGHLKSEHHKEFLPIYIECKNCQCSRYLRYDYPEKSNTVSFYIGIFGIIGISIMFIALCFELYNIDSERTIPITFFRDVVLSLFGVITFFTVVIYYTEMVRFYIRNKRRRTF